MSCPSPRHSPSINTVQYVLCGCGPLLPFTTTPSCCVSVQSRRDATFEFQVFGVHYSPSEGPTVSRPLCHLYAGRLPCTCDGDRGATPGASIPATPRCRTLTPPSTTTATFQKVGCPVATRQAHTKRAPAFCENIAKASCWFLIAE